MTRKLEQRLVYAASAWQILTGLITIFVYSFYIRSQAQTELNALEPTMRLGFESFFDSVFMFSVSYGMLFVVLAVFNIMFAKKLLKGGVTLYAYPFFLLASAIGFYFLNDFISTFILAVAGVITLSKNKAVKLSCEN